MTDIFAYTSQGGREYNEDFVGYALTDSGAVIALCDGLGGVSGSEMASRIAVDTLIDLPYECDDPAGWLSDRLSLAHERVISEQKKLNNSMKSTVAALRIDGDRAVWAHAGDSRLYHIRGGMISDVTADHTAAFKKYLAGQIARTAICTDEDRSTLLNSIGCEGKFTPEFGSAHIRTGDGFVLCSDGVWENLIDQEIAFDHLKADTAERWAELLLLRVVDRMPADADNLSIITVMV